MYVFNTIYEKLFLLLQTPPFPICSRFKGYSLHGPANEMQDQSRGSVQLPYRASTYKSQSLCFTWFCKPYDRAIRGLLKVPTYSCVDWDTYGLNELLTLIKITYICNMIQSLMARQNNVSDETKKNNWEHWKTSI